MSQEPIEVRLKRIDEEREKIQNKMQELNSDLMVFPENYQQLSREIRILLQEAKDLEENSSATPEQAMKIDETIKHLQDQDRICNAKASKVEEEKSEGLYAVIKDGIAHAPQPAATGKLTPQEGIAEMQRLLDEARQSPDKKVRFENQNKVMSITNRVAMVNQNPEYIQKLQSVLREFKSLNAAAAAVGQTAGQQQNAENLYQAALSGHRLNEIAQELQSKATVPPADLLGVDEKSIQTSALPVVINPDERVSTPNDIEPSQLLKDFKALANIMPSFSVTDNDKSLELSRGNETLSIHPDKGGVKFSGSPEMGAEMLNRWQAKNGWDNLDVKISMPTVGKNIDAKRPEGEAAWKTFSAYNQKGYLVKDFPIDNFKDKPNYQEMKQRYDDMKQQVVTKETNSTKRAG